MKAYKKQMYLNLAITAAAVGCACLVLMVGTSSPELRALDAENGYYAHTSYQKRRAVANNTAWDIPTVSTTAPRATATVARTSAAATPTTPTATQSLVRNTFGAGSTQTSSSNGGGSGSSYAGGVARSQTVSMSPVTSISLNAIRRSTGTQVAATSSITEPFSDPQRPQGEIHQRVVNEGPDEPFFEPLGDGLWFLLLCSSLFMLRTAIATKMRKSPPAP
ncbi:MAG: hypothetical protein ACI30H_05985 [Paludibacteraceae bacterium]